MDVGFSLCTLAEITDPNNLAPFELFTEISKFLKNANNKKKAHEQAMIFLGQLSQENRINVSKEFFLQNPLDLLGQCYFESIEESERKKQALTHRIRACLKPSLKITDMVQTVVNMAGLGGKLKIYANLCRVCTWCPQKAKDKAGYIIFNSWDNLEEAWKIEVASMYFEVNPTFEPIAIFLTKARERKNVLDFNRLISILDEQNKDKRLRIRAACICLEAVKNMTEASLEKLLDSLLSLKGGAIYRKIMEIKLPARLYTQTVVNKILRLIGDFDKGLNWLSVRKLGLPKYVCGFAANLAQQQKGQAAYTFINKYFDFVKRNENICFTDIIKGICELCGDKNADWQLNYFWVKNNNRHHNQTTVLKQIVCKFFDKITCISKNEKPAIVLEIKRNISCLKQYIQPYMLVIAAKEWNDPTLGELGIGLLKDRLNAYFNKEKEIEIEKSLRIGINFLIQNQNNREIIQVLNILDKNKDTDPFIENFFFFEEMMVNLYTYLNNCHHLRKIFETLNAFVQLYERDKRSSSLDFEVAQKAIQIMKIIPIEKATEISSPVPPKTEREKVT
jgi:hypothetical protein